MINGGAIRRGSAEHVHHFAVSFKNHLRSGDLAINGKLSHGSLEDAAITSKRGSKKLCHMSPHAIGDA
jgi:hypothetical protein